MAPVTKAQLDLAALVVMWLGTVLITLVGVPQVFASPLLAQDGALLLDSNGAMLTARPDPEQITAYWHYMIYAIPGVGLITLGMIWQCVEPAKTAFKGKLMARRGATSGG